MKIGILTYFIGQNYGAALQAYATLLALRKLGHDPVFIHYHQPWSKGPSFFDPRSYLSKSFGGFLAKCGRMRKQWHLRREFGKMEQLFPRTERYYHSDLQLLQQFPPDCDVYLVGSDQVWKCPESLEHAEAYFLPFGSANVRRVSYASSMGGHEFPRDVVETVKQYLSAFQSISVREKGSTDYLTAMGVRGVAWVPDPTILLTQRDYADFIESASPTGADCMVYLLHQEDPEVRALVEQSVEPYTKVLNVPLHSFHLSGAENRIIGVPAFVRSIAEAEMLVTNSFHCVVFALLLHRPFVFIQLIGKHKKMNNRVAELLEGLGLTERMIDPEHPVSPSEIQAQVIDWTEVDAKIAILRQVGWDYLEPALERESAE